MFEENIEEYFLSSLGKEGLLQQDPNTVAIKIETIINLILPKLKYFNFIFYKKYINKYKIYLCFRVASIT